MGRTPRRTDDMNDLKAKGMKVIALDLLQR